MIDPITAFATAQAAVAGIQKAIKLGKDVHGLVGEFGKLFDASDALNRAANDAGKTGKSDTAMAMEIVGKRNQLREQMEHLKHTLVYTGYPEMWEQMLIERSRIQKERERAEREARKAKEKRRQQLMLTLAYGFIAFGLVGVILAFVYVITAVNP